MKNYTSPEVELIYSLTEDYCDGSIETDNVSSATAEGGMETVTLPKDPMGELL